MMQTDDLIAHLAAEAAPQPFVPRRIGALAVASILGPVAAFLLVAGVRPDLSAAWSNPVVPLKTILPLVICALSLSVLLRLARPGRRAGAPGWLLLAPVLAAALVWLGAFVLRAPAERFAEVGPASVGECLGAILVLSVLPATVLMRLLRQGAPTRPALSGALIGLTAATGVATGYSLFCTQDNPLFFVSWYGFGILAVATVGAVIGRRALSW